MYKLITVGFDYGFDCLQKRFDGILFSSSLHLKEVFLIAILLCPQSSQETQGSTVRAFHSHLRLQIDVCKQSLVRFAGAHKSSKDSVHIIQTYQTLVSIEFRCTPKVLV